jgi:tRNA threonylcarbamoyladenosine biosynthesis protein TsaE
VTSSSGAATVIEVATADDMRRLGAELAHVLRPGDLVVLSGALGAGKTTLTQGIGSGLGVRGGVTSPTFVIARVHPSIAHGPPMVHVDAYRLEALAEIDDLDLDATLSEAVTVVEWGQGKVERLAEDRLEITIEPPVGNTENRRVTITTTGSRWDGVTLLLAARWPSDAQGPDPASTD